MNYQDYFGYAKKNKIEFGDAFNMLCNLGGIETITEYQLFWNRMVQFDYELEELTVEQLEEVNTIPMNKIVKTLILQADECAPDARLYFEIEFSRRMGLTLQDFQKVAIRSDYEFEVQYKLNEYTLESSGDSPQWALYQHEEVTAEISDFNHNTDLF